jgi:hypothetical protein
MSWLLASAVEQAPSLGSYWQNRPAAAGFFVHPADRIS